MAMVDNRITGVVNSAVGTTEPASQLTNIMPKHGKTHKAHAKQHATADMVTISSEAQNAATSNLTASAVKQTKGAETIANTYEDKTSKAKRG